MSLQPATFIDKRYGNPEASATPWSAAWDTLRGAEVCWITTIRPDNSIHVVPLMTVCANDRIYFGTGVTEQKFRNLEQRPSCVISTGCNTFAHELDVIVEGDATRILDQKLLHTLSDAWVDKYGEAWRYDVIDGGFMHSAVADRSDHRVLAAVFEIVPIRGYGFTRAGTFSQTRWVFEN